MNLALEAIGIAEITKTTDLLDNALIFQTENIIMESK